MLLAVASSAIGCTTTAVNFVVTDAEAKTADAADAAVPDGTAVPDGLDVDALPAIVNAADAADGKVVSTGGPDAAVDDVANAVPVDAVMSDVAALDLAGETASRPADLDAQVADAGEPAFAVGAPVSGPSRYAEYKCCTSLTGPCYVGYQGSDTTCRDEATWTTYANAACADQGRVMVGLGMYVGC